MGEWSKEVGRQYEEQREAERKELVRYLLTCSELKARGIGVVSRGRVGKGKEDYTSGKRIPTYNLKNWKWVEVKNEAQGFSCVISLNMPELDPGSGNVHCLYDRIGFQIFCKTKKRFYQTEIFTDINLPLKGSDKREIMKTIITQFDILHRQRTRETERPLLPHKHLVSKGERRYTTMKEKAVSLTLALALCLGLTIPAGAADVTFTDVKSTDWYYAPVSQAIEGGYMKGYGNGYFGANDPMNLDQVAQVLFNLEKPWGESNSTNSYWAQQAVIWNLGQNFIPLKGPDTYTVTAEFYSVPATREEAAAAIVKFAICKGAVDTTADDEHFPDEAQMSPDLVEYANLARKNGLVKGYDDGAFHPQDQLTRAQFAQLIANLVSVCEQAGVELKMTSKEQEKPVFDPATAKYIGWDHNYDDETPAYGGNYLGEFEGWKYVAGMNGYVPEGSVGVVQINDDPNFRY